MTDQVDSVHLTLDDQGKTLSRVEYMPYGETFVQKGDNDFAPKYNSQELDKETGFYFYNARYYDPEISRFTIADSVIDGEYDTQGWNRYAYVKGNPVRWKDPTGHDLTEIIVNGSNRISEHFERRTAYYKYMAENSPNIVIESLWRAEQALGIICAALTKVERADVELAALTFGGSQAYQKSKQLATGTARISKIIGPNLSRKLANAGSSAKKLLKYSSSSSNSPSITVYHKGLLNRPEKGSLSTGIDKAAVDPI